MDHLLGCLVQLTFNYSFRKMAIATLILFRSIQSYVIVQMNFIYCQICTFYGHVCSWVLLSLKWSIHWRIGERLYPSTNKISCLRPGCSCRLLGALWEISQEHQRKLYRQPSSPDISASWNLQLGISIFSNSWSPFLNLFSEEKLYNNFSRAGLYIFDYYPNKLCLCPVCHPFFPPWPEASSKVKDKQWNKPLWCNVHPFCTCCDVSCIFKGPELSALPSLHHSLHHCIHGVLDALSS